MVLCSVEHIVRKLKSISNFPKQLVEQKNCVYHKTQASFGFETSSQTFFGVVNI